MLWTPHPKALLNSVKPLVFITIFCALLLTGCNGNDPHKQQVHSEKTVHTAALSKNGNYALVAATNQPAALWDTRRHQRLYQWRHDSSNEHAIIFTDITPDGKTALTAEPGTIILWDTTTGESRGYWQMPAKIHDVVLSDDGQYAVVALGNNEAHYIDFTNNQLIAKLPHQDKINSVAISTNGRFAVTGSDDKTAKLWLLKDGQQLRSWPHDKRVTRVAIASDNRTVMTNSAQGGIYLWDANSKKMIRKFDSAPTSVTAAKFSKNGKLLATASPPRILTIWDVKKGKNIQEWLLPKTDFWKPTSVIVHDITFLPNDKFIMTEDSTGLGQVWSIR